MKGRLLNLLICCLLALPFTGCNEAKIPLLTPPADTGVVHDMVPSKVGELTDGSPRLMLDDGKVKNALASEIGQGASVEEVFIKREEESGRYYLHGFGTLNGVSKAIRVALEEQNGNLVVASGTKSEICSATNCDDCDFLPQGGCGCNSNPPERRNTGCVHSITHGSYIYLMFK